MSSFYRIFPDNENISLKVSGAHINRVEYHLKHDVVAFITAFRKGFSANENLRRNEKLRQELNNLGCGYIRVLGCYPELHDGKKETVKEKSFIVICNEVKQLADEKDKIEESDEFKENILKLGYKYNQDSVLIRYYIGEGQFKTQELGTNVLPPGNPVNKEFTGEITTDYLASYWTRIHNNTFSMVEKDDDNPDKQASLSFDFAMENASRYNDFKTGGRWRTYSATVSSIRKCNYRI